MEREKELRMMRTALATGFVALFLAGAIGAIGVDQRSRETVRAAIRGISPGAEHRILGVVNLLRAQAEDKSDSDLRNAIRAALPGIDQDLAERRLDGVGRLMEWAAGEIPFGLDASVQIAPDLLLKQPAGRTYNDIWRTRTKGALCGGAALFFHKILTLFGVPSFSVHAGHPAAAVTHAFNVVPVADGARRKFYMFDPTFGGTYRAADGSHVDIIAALRGAAATYSARPVYRPMIYSRASASLVAAMRTEMPDIRMDCATDQTGVGICEGALYVIHDLRRLGGDQLPSMGIGPSDDMILGLIRNHVAFVSGEAGMDVRAEFLSSLPR